MSSKLIQLLRGKSSERIMLHLVAAPKYPMYPISESVCCRKLGRQEKAHSLFLSLKRLLFDGANENFAVVDLREGG